MDEVFEVIQKMRVSRGWDKTDTIATLIKSVSAEAGELLETIQWSDDKYDPNALEGELADVLMYALSICIDLKLDPKTIIEKKIGNVYERYPEVNKE